ncbi:hypothetical protein X975_24801, partial [Stegodyphus mimosarum]
MEGRIDAVENKVHIEESFSSVKEQIEERVSSVKEQTEGRVSAVQHQIEQQIDDNVSALGKEVDTLKKFVETAGSFGLDSECSIFKHEKKKAKSSQNFLYLGDFAHYSSFLPVERTHVGVGDDCIRVKFATQHILAMSETGEASSKERRVD